MRHFGIFLRSNVAELAGFLKEIESICKLHDITLCFEEGNPYGFLGFSLKEIEEKCELLISFGGDGTLISALHKINSLPILGVNAGKLGFLTGVSLKDFSAFLPCLVQKDFRVEAHSMLSVFLEGKKIANALNEVLISKKTFSAMIDIEAHIDEKILNRYYCDGLIVGTPTGSTAYNVSAGGSVVYPFCKNILLTPLAPHSLTQRPMILDDRARLKFQVKQDSQIIIDGQRVFDFPSDAKLSIFYQGEHAKLICAKDYDYFSILREKFNWGK